VLAAGHSVGRPWEQRANIKGAEEQPATTWNPRTLHENYWDNTAPIFKQLCAEITLRLIVLATAVSNRMGYVAPTNMKDERRALAFPKSSFDS